MKYSSIALLCLGTASAVQIKNKWWEDDGIIDALTPQIGHCEERLWIHPEELEWQMDQFSRKCEKENYMNVMVIADKLGVPPPKVHAWELNDAAFSFARIRRYDFVQQNMDMLEHFQDNLNQNLSNLVAVDNFIRVCQTTRANFNGKYKDGEYGDPAGYDPRAHRYDKPTW